MSTGNGERAVADRKFVASLTGNRAARLLRTHLVCVAKHEDGDARESSMQEAVTNERVLITAIAQSLVMGRPMPCGLPSDLPKFIVICNLSGERLILYGNNPSLIRRLCTRSSVIGPRDVAYHLFAFEKFPFMDDNPEIHKFVLLSYSMPWQAGVGSAFWTISTCGYSKAQQCLRDRLLTFTSHSNEAFPGKPIQDPSDAGVRLKDGTLMPLVTEKDLTHLKDTYCCSCVDFDEPDVKPQAIVDDPRIAKLGTGNGPANSAMEKRVHQLNGIIEHLKAGRTNDGEEIKQLKVDAGKFQERIDSLTDKYGKEIGKERLKYEKEIEKKESTFKEAEKKFTELQKLYKSNESALRAEVKACEEKAKRAAYDHALLAKEKKALTSKLEEAKRQATSKDKLANAASSKYKLTISQGEEALAAARSELEGIRSAMEQAHSRVLEEQREKHAKEVERLKTALEGKTRIMNQLSEVSERREAEVQSLQAVDALKGTAINDLEDEIAKLKRQVEEERAKPRTRSVAVSTRNSSTSTHSCQTTQTVPPPRPPSTPPPASAEPKEKDVAIDADPTHATATTTAATPDSEPTPATPVNLQNPAAGGFGSDMLCHNATIAVQSLVAHVCALENQAVAAGYQPMQFPYFLHPQHQLAAPPPKPHTPGRHERLQRQRNSPSAPQQFHNGIPNPYQQPQGPVYGVPAMFMG